MPDHRSRGHTKRIFHLRVPFGYQRQETLPFSTLLHGCNTDDTHKRSRFGAGSWTGTPDGAIIYPLFCRTRSVAVSTCRSGSDRFSPRRKEISMYYPPAGMSTLDCGRDRLLNYGLNRSIAAGSTLDRGKHEQFFRLFDGDAWRIISVVNEPIVISMPVSPVYLH